MSDTATPLPKGKKTYYPNKVAGKPVTTALTQESRDEIDRVSRIVSEASGKECSRSDLLEHAWRVIRGIGTSQELTNHLRLVPLPVLSGIDSSTGTVYTKPEAVA